MVEAQGTAVVVGEGRAWQRWEEREKGGGGVEGRQREKGGSGFSEGKVFTPLKFQHPRRSFENFARG